MSVERWVGRKAAKLCDPDTRARLIDPILSDIEHECRESYAAGRPWLARWCRLRGYVGLCKAAAIHCGYLCVRGRVNEGAGRTIMFTLAAFVVLTFTLMLPSLPISLQRHPAEVVWYLIPQALPFSIPAAVALGVCGGWSRRPAWRTLLARVALLGIAGALAALSTMEWLIPGANQEFRVMVMRQVGAERVHIVRGIGERSLSELLWLVRETSPDREHANGDDAVAAVLREISMGGSPVTHEILQLNLHQRLALSLATAVLCLLAVAMAGVIPRRHLARATFAGAAVLYVEAYSMAAVVAPAFSPALVGWLPNAAVTTLSLLLLSFSARGLGEGAREAREVGRC